MKGHCSAGQSPQWAVVPVEEEEEGGGGGGGGEEEAVPHTAVRSV